MRNLFFVTGAILIFSWGFARSQSVVTSTASLVTPLTSLGASARTDALGGAFTGVADDPSALFFNSAGLSGLQDARISLNHNSYLAGTFEETLLVGLPAGDLGGFAGAVQYVFWGALDERNAFGVDQGTSDDSDIALSLGWGKFLSKNFSIGAAVYGTQQKIVETLYSSLSGQAGILWIPWKDFRAGLVYTGFGTPVSGQSLANDLKGGVSNLFRWGSDKTFLLAFSGYYEPNGVSQLQGGLEAGFQKNYFIRAGYQLPLSNNLISGFTGFTAGAGVRIESLTLDYAFVPYGDLGMSNRVSLAYDFPNPTPVVKPVTVFAPVPANPVTVFVTPTPVSQVMPAASAKSSVAVHFEVPIGAAPTITDFQLAALIQKLEQATETDPGNASAWHQLGNAYWKAGKTDMAVQCLQQASRLNPADMKLKIWLDQYQAAHPQSR
jgi:tetratricopeptide (TPR) repeat protein